MAPRQTPPSALLPVTKGGVPLASVCCHLQGPERWLGTDGAGPPPSPPWGKWAVVAGICRPLACPGLALQEQPVWPRAGPAEGAPGEAPVCGVFPGSESSMSTYVPDTKRCSRCRDTASVSPAVLGEGRGSPGPDAAVLSCERPWLPVACGFLLCLPPRSRGKFLFLMKLCSPLFFKKEEVNKFCSFIGVSATWSVSLKSPKGSAYTFML